MNSQYDNPDKISGCCIGIIWPRLYLADQQKIHMLGKNIIFY